MPTIGCVKPRPKVVVAALPAEPDDVTLDLDFANEYGYMVGYGVAGLKDLIGLIGGANGSRFTGDGNFEGPISAPRIGFNSVSRAPRGVILEEPRTNSIRSSMMQGAAAGVPGTLPPNWSTYTALTGLTRQVGGVTTVTGLPCLDLRVSGTPSGAGTYVIFTESASQIPGVAGNAFTFTAFSALVGGSMTGITSIVQSIQERDTTGNTYYTGGNSSAISLTPNIVLNTYTYTAVNALTAKVVPVITLILTGAPIDITLRIGLPQFEQAAFATSPIPTFGAAVNRTIDQLVISGADFSRFFNPLEGTFEQWVELTDVSAQRTGFSANRAGTWQDSISFYISPIGLVRGDLYVGGAGQTTLTNGTAATGSSVKHALAYRLNDCASSSSISTPVSTDTSCLIPSVTQLSIGTSGTGSAQALDGRCKRLRYRRTRRHNGYLPGYVSP